jgi:hypothetical protein
MRRLCSLGGQNFRELLEQSEMHQRGMRVRFTREAFDLGRRRQAFVFCGHGVATKAKHAPALRVTANRLAKTRITRLFRVE